MGEAEEMHSVPDEGAIGVPLTAASYQKCSRTLARGEVKRVMQRGPLVGYYIGCPACGFVGCHLDDECGFVEATGIGGRPMVVAIQRPPRCYRCQRVLVVESDRLLAI